MNLLLSARILFVALFATVTFLTLTPNPDDTKSGMALTRWLASFLFGQEALGDKIAHFAAYGVLGVSAILARLRFFGRRIFTVLALAFYGAALEGIQGLGGVRTPEFADAVANALGALCAYPVGAIIMRLLNRLNRRVTL